MRRAGRSSSRSSGTVVGAISASLKSATVTLTAPARASARKASKHAQAVKRGPPPTRVAPVVTARPRVATAGLALAAGGRRARTARRARERATRAATRHSVTRARLATSTHRPAARAASGGATPTSVLAPTPYMGWDTYFTFGARYDEASVLEQASELKTRGLEKDGYRYVWLDVGWWQGTRNANGEITVSPSQWPHGMRWLTNTLHAAGFKVGLYTDAGSEGCGGPNQGSYGHYQQDVNTFAAWGFDAVKVDFCGGVRQGLSSAAAYAEFHEAIVHNSSHRPMLLSICDYLQPGQFATETPTLAKLGLRLVHVRAEQRQQLAHRHRRGRAGGRGIRLGAAQPRCRCRGTRSRRPGALERPGLPRPGSRDVQRSISQSIQHVGDARRAADGQRGPGVALEREPDDDLQPRPRSRSTRIRRACRRGCSSSSGNGEVWVKPLANGDRAVALLNRGSSTLELSTTTTAIGMPAASGYLLRNVWTGAVAPVGSPGTIRPASRATRRSWCGSRRARTRSAQPGRALPRAERAGRRAELRAQSGWGSSDAAGFSFWRVA